MTSYHFNPAEFAKVISKNAENLFYKNLREELIKCATAEVDRAIEGVRRDIVAYSELSYDPFGLHRNKLYVQITYTGNGITFTTKDDNS